MLRRVLYHGTQQGLNTFETNIQPLFYIYKVNSFVGRWITHFKLDRYVVLIVCHSVYAAGLFHHIINMAVGHPELVDYTATKGAIVGFMRAFSN